MKPRLTFQPDPPAREFALAHMALPEAVRRLAEAAENERRNAKAGYARAPRGSRRRADANHISATTAALRIETDAMRGRV